MTKGSVVAVLVAVVVPLPLLCIGGVNYLSARARGPQEQTYRQLTRLIAALDTLHHALPIATPPATIAEVRAAMRSQPRDSWEVAYDGDFPSVDAWGHPLRYRVTDVGVTIWSLGRDGIPQFETPPSDCTEIVHPDDDIVMQYVTGVDGYTCVQMPYTLHGCRCPEGRTWWVRQVEDYASAVFDWSRPPG